MESEGAPASGPTLPGTSALERLPLPVLQAVLDAAGSPAVFRASSALRALFRRPLRHGESVALLRGASEGDFAGSPLADSVRLQFFRAKLLRGLAGQDSDTDAALASLERHPWFDEYVAAQLARCPLPDAAWSLLFVYGVRREREVRLREAGADTSGPQISYPGEANEAQDDTTDAGDDNESDDGQAEAAEGVQADGEAENDSTPPTLGPRLRNIVLGALVERFPPPADHCCCHGDCDLTNELGEREKWTLADALLVGATLGDAGVVAEAIARGAPWCARLGEMAVSAAVLADHKGAADLVLDHRARHHRRHAESPAPPPPTDPVLLACELDRHRILPSLLDQYPAGPEAPADGPADIFSEEPDEEEPLPTTYFDHVVRNHSKRRPPKATPRPRPAPLLAASRRGHDQSVRALLLHPSWDPDDPPSGTTLPLLYAVLNDHRATVRALLASDAPAHLPYPYPFSALPLLLGVLAGSRGAVLALLPAQPREAGDPVAQGDFLLLRLAAYFGDAGTADALLAWSRAAGREVRWEEVAAVGTRFGLGGMVRWAAARMRREVESGRTSARGGKGRERGWMGRAADAVQGVVGAAADFFGLSYRVRLAAYRARVAEELGPFAPCTDPLGVPRIFGFEGHGLAIPPLDTDADGAPTAFDPRPAPGLLPPHPGLPRPMRFPHLGRLLRNDVVSAVSLLGSMLSVQQEGDGDGDAWESEAEAGVQGPVDEADVLAAEVD